MPVTHCIERSTIGDTGWEHGRRQYLPETRRQAAVGVHELQVVANDHPARVIFDHWIFGGSG